MAAWYAIRTGTRQEARALASIGELEVAAYLPCERVFRRLGGKREPVNRPLFPGYLFVRCEPEELAVMIDLDGVHDCVRMVNEAGQLVAVPFAGKVIGEVFFRQLCGEFDYTQAPIPFRPARGDRVGVNGGKWGALGYIGTVLSVSRNERRAIVRLDAGFKAEVETGHLVAAE